MFTSFPFISLTSFGKRRRIANSINCGTLHLSGRAAVIFVEIKIDYTSKVRSTEILNLSVNDLFLKRTTEFNPFNFNI